MSVSVAHICDFLQFKFDASVQSQTLCGYVAAISTFHQGFAQGSLAQVKLVKDFLKGAFCLCLPVKEIVPRWDLGVVPTALTEGPYEPLERPGSRHGLGKQVSLLPHFCG